MNNLLTEYIFEDKHDMTDNDYYIDMEYYHSLSKEEATSIIDENYDIVDKSMIDIKNRKVYYDVELSEDDKYNIMYFYSNYGEYFEFVYDKNMFYDFEPYIANDDPYYRLTNYQDYVNIINNNVGNKREVFISMYSGDIVNLDFSNMIYDDFRRYMNGKWSCGLEEIFEKYAEDCDYRTMLEENKQLYNLLLEFSYQETLVDTFGNDSESDWCFNCWTKEEYITK